jgi:EAL domain-containing protein (putative c-di-GMP-specific phosphodiesterase class I)
MAEESGLIVSLGYQVLEQACRQFAQWRQRFPNCEPLSLSVNLSRWQLVEIGLVDQIEQILRRSGCPPDQLCLEITESAIMENAMLARRVLEALRDKGIRLSMDDFGTGYSSLSFLHQFPIDVLKIDRSFVYRMDTESNGGQIVSTIVTLGHSLNMKVVAEGIETPSAADRLRQMGCDAGQGFLFAQPMPAEAATDLLAARCSRPS